VGDHRIAQREAIENVDHLEGCFQADELRPLTVQVQAEPEFPFLETLCADLLGFANVVDGPVYAR
jgi:hypothetical protein